MVSSVAQTAYPPTRRAPSIPTTNQSIASPTESEFSDVDGPDSVKNWDEDRVCEYLRSVKCGEYEKLFRKNHINGENLLEMDKEVLKEMGIEKVGDRVRLFLCIKKLRTKAYANQKKRNRVSRQNITSMGERKIRRKEKIYEEKKEKVEKRLTGHRRNRSAASTFSMSRLLDHHGLLTREHEACQPLLPARGTPGNMSLRRIPPSRLRVQIRRWPAPTIGQLDQGPAKPQDMEASRRPPHPRGFPSLRQPLPILAEWYQAIPGTIRAWMDH
jgi:hypothetical protein